MTRRRRVRRRLLWAGVLLSLALLLATLSVLRVALWTGQRTASLERPTRKENAMFGRTSFAIVAALGALLVAAPASAESWGADRNDDGAVTSMLDAHERSFDLKQVANPAPGWFERLAAAHSLREPVVDDRFRIDPANTAAPVAVSGSSEIEWPRIGVGLALGLLLGLGLMLAVRMTNVRSPVAR
jgi:hypothetical protein